MYVATKEAIGEMTAALAAIAVGANNGTPDSKVEGDRADLLKLPAITKAVIDKFGHFKLKLVEINPDNHMFYVNYFIFDCIVLIDNTYFVMKGELSIGGRPYSIGYVRYKFEKNTWQRVKFSRSGKVSDIIEQLEPFKPNAQIAYDVTSFFKDFVDKEEQDINTAMSQNPDSSKPLTQREKANLYGDYLSAYNKKKAITPTEQL